MNLLLLNEHQLMNQQATINDQRQLAHVRQHLNLSIGDTLKVGVKNGLKGTAVVESITSEQLLLNHLQLDQPPPTKLPLILIVALPRPKALRRLVMDATTLGVAQIYLIHSYRVEKSYWQTPFLQQLEHYIELGIEQAGDTVAPAIHVFKRFRPFVEDILPTLIEGKQALVAHPYASQAMPYATAQPTVLIIGPEGGFIPFEVELLQANGCQVAHIGERILRCETAISSIIGRLFV